MRGINALHAQGGVIHSNHAPFKPFLLPGTRSHESRSESYSPPQVDCWVTSADYTDCGPGSGQSLEWRSVSGYYERSRQRIFFQTDIVFYSYSPQYLGADVVMIVEAGDIHLADYDMPSFGIGWRTLSVAYYIQEGHFDFHLMHSRNIDAVPTRYLPYDSDMLVMLHSYHHNLILCTGCL